MDKGSKKSDSFQKNGGGNFSILDFLNYIKETCACTHAPNVCMYTIRSLKGNNELECLRLLNLR